MPLCKFLTFVYSSSQLINVELPIAATRAGAIGVINAELEDCPENITSCIKSIEQPLRGANGEYGIKLGRFSKEIVNIIEPYLQSNLKWLIVDSACASEYIAALKSDNIKILVECTNSEEPACVTKNLVDGIIIKGNESGGFVGEESSFILLQKWAKQTDLPIYVRGGLTPHVAAACSALGIAGGVLDSQVLLLNDSPVQRQLQKIISPLAGSETVAVGDGAKGNYCRILNRPQLKEAKKFIKAGESKSLKELQKLVADSNINWSNPTEGILPVGHDICFAEGYRKQYKTVAKLIAAINSAAGSYATITANNPPLCEDSPLAQDLAIKYPIVQGPMTRVSDTAKFATAIAEGGALPMLAFALMKGEKIKDLLAETKRIIGDKTWGIGLLGFVPPAMLKEQIAAALPFKPNYAIIAGGRPDQAVALEAQGIPSFLHLPSANLLENFLKGGARRFIFEGRECGGHIGPLSSFTLWSTMIDRLLTSLDECQVPGEDVQCLFAGGIHDEFSSAMLQVMVAPLIEKGVKIGIIMGSAYLFTKEIVAGGGIIEQFQQTVVDCKHTVNLESGPGHASRCAYTPFAKTFFAKQVEVKAKLPADEAREELDKMILGTLRVASKGVTRQGDEIVKVSKKEQKQNGMYMLGQVVPLRDKVITIDQLHKQVTQGAIDKIHHSSTHTNNANHAISDKQQAADIAIVGMECALPGAKNTRQFWQNILNKVDSVTEVPKHRWDYRLYFDENRNAKDKVYSKWGGFMEDMPFDPMKYGITPKSITSVDPMQLMTLEVARAALDDSSYDYDDEAKRKKTSVIIGASGGAGDVGMQYGLRSEFPRFVGELPEGVADKLPEWSEDTFAGILINVVPGRIANRLNLGGVNYITDAACASSLSAVYQAVGELQNGNSDIVIAGGSDTVQGAFGYMCFSQTQALSPTGRCRTFDESSDGIVISEGIVMLVMKRLEDAIRDGDRVYSVIKGVGGGSDGKAKGLSAPLPEGQLRAMNRAYEQAGFLPDSVRLFEAHGTGTVAGDSAELESTSSLINQYSDKPRNAIVGSVKTSIGHTKATAGVAGLMKASLALYHKTLPPHMGVKKPNATLADKDFPLYIIDEAQPWVTDNKTPRRAAVSAFGFGGTNFHVALEEYQSEYRPWLQQSVADKWKSELFLFSGHNNNALSDKLANIQNILVQNPDIYARDLAYALANSYNSEDILLAVVAEDLVTLSDKIAKTLEHFNNATKLPNGVYLSNKADGKLAVLFSGQGSQYCGMLQEAAVYFPELSDTLSAADACLAVPFAKRFAGKNLSSFIFPRGAYDKEAQKQAEQQLTSTDITQPALGAVEAGLWQLMKNFGLNADMLAGHSYGEFAALYAAGKISFKDLMTVSEARGRLIVDKAAEGGSELGSMLAVKAKRQDAEKVINKIKDVVIANHNAPEQVIISGSGKAIDDAANKLKELGIKSVKLPVAAAFHSKFVEPAQNELAKVINELDWLDGDDVAVYSNNKAKAHNSDIRSIKKSMAEHLTGPVEFVAQIEQMYADGARVFLELGPKNVLSRLTNNILGNKPHTTLAIDDNGRGVTGVLHCIAQLLCAGIELDVSKLFAGRECLQIKLDDINKQQRTPELSKHAWLLNGSGARRAHEEVKQSGVTAEEAHNYNLSINNPTLKPTSEDESSGVSSKNKNMPRTYNNSRANSASRPRVSQALNNNKRTIMKDKEANGFVTQAYFDLVSQQLNNARDVALAELGVNLDSASVPSSAPQRPQRSRNVVAMPTRQTVQAPRANVNIAPQPETSAKEEVATVAEEPKTANSNKLDTAAIKKIILNIVTDKTGYEDDMIEFNQNLEADLGVDSIKRVDIVGGVLDALPDNFKDAIGDEGRTSLNTAKTLDDMLAILNKAGEANVNFNYAGAVSKESEVKTSTPLPRLSESRFEMTAIAEPIDESAIYSLNKGEFIIIKDKGSVAETLIEKLQQQDCTIHIAPTSNEEELQLWCDAQDIKSVSGIIHLAALDSETIDPQSSPIQWKEQLFVNEKSLFLLIKNFKLAADAHVLCATGLGGDFSRNKSNGINLQGGSVGLIKSLCKEREKIRGKAIDLDLELSPQTNVQILFNELSVAGGRIEVGYPGAIRTVFKTTATTDESGDNPPAIEDTDLVILATGGARGVTAEVLREVAKPGNVLIITGRSPLPDTTHTMRNGETAKLYSEKELTRYFVKSESLALGDARKKANKVLAAREMLDNIADFEQDGAKVEYKAVDVTDEQAMATMIKDIYQDHGSIDGVVHGAGIIEDKFLADISSESWSRVVETKVIGLLLLNKYIDSDKLKFLCVFSSVAGRYGNSGQSNYACANELMNRICNQLSNKINASALCWGPWGKTKFGTGMVNEATEAKFAKQDVYLVHAQLGRDLFRHQLTTKHNEVEVICGKAPWEEYEANKGKIQTAVPKNGSLLGSTTIEALPTGGLQLNFTIDKSHVYLQDHVIDGQPVLPMAVAMEMMANAVAESWGEGWVVAEITDAKLFKGIIIDKDEYPLTILMTPTSHGTEETNNVKVKIISADEKPKPHYGASIKLAPALPVCHNEIPDIAWKNIKKIDAKIAYDKHLFHGPTFQVIDKIEKLSEQGARCDLRSTNQGDFINGGSSKNWFFDPALVDAAAHMSVLWMDIFRNSFALPMQFGRIVRFTNNLPQNLNMDYVIKTETEDSVTVDAYFTNSDGNILLLIEDMKHVASKTHKTGVNKAA